MQPAGESYNWPHTLRHDLAPMSTQTEGFGRYQAKALLREALGTDLFAFYLSLLLQATLWI